MAAAWANPLFKLYAKDDWKLIVLAKFGCPLSTTVKYFNASIGGPKAQQECIDAKPAEIAAINDAKPDILFVSNTYIVPAGPNGTPTPDEWQTGFSNELAKVTEAKTTVILTPSPTGGTDRDPTNCYTPRSTPAACLSTVTTSWMTAFEGDWKTTQARKNTVLVDTRPFFCTSQGQCPVFEDKYFIRRDQAHPTYTYMNQILDQWSELLLSYGIDVPGEGKPADFVQKPAATTTGSGSGPAVTAVQAKLSSALQAGSWPDLSPSVNDLPDAGLADEFKEGCSSARGDDCYFKSSKIGGSTIAVLGDSLGVALLPTVRSAFGSDHSIKGLTQISCALTDLDVKWSSDSQKTDCMSARSAGIDWIKKNKPETVFVIQNYDFANHLNSSSGLADQWISADNKLISQISSSVKQIIFVAPSVTRAPLTQCKTARSTPSDCVATPAPFYKDIFAKESSGLTAPAKFLDMTQLFCVQQRCPDFSGSTPILADNSHPTKQYAVQIAPAFREMTEKLGVS